MIKYFIGVSVLLVFIFFTASCGTLDSKRGSDIEGPMASDIVTKDVDTDPQGSDGGNIRGLSTVFFAYDSSSLSDLTKDTLRRNAEWLQRKSRVSRIELEGHCDSMGSEAYNIGLGLRRAQAVKTFLLSVGIEDDKLSIVSYGEERPLSSNHSRNRRVNFVPIY